MSRYVLALDQGTTSSRAILFDLKGSIVRLASRPLGARYPSDGWVEQDAEEIWRTQQEAALECARGVEPAEIAVIGLTNQRETTVCWDRRTGEALAPAIVWQCRRSEAICERLRSDGALPAIRRKTGLVIDPYFSLTKIIWLLENVPGLRGKAADGQAVFGTVDAWILYRLTGGPDGGVIRTEPSNASRTSLFALDTLQWDDELLRLAGVTAANLPEVMASDALLGRTSLFGGDHAIHGALGDQQASLLGHGATDAGTMKCTFGTGAFLLSHAGRSPVVPEGGLLGTVAWARRDERPAFAVEGSVFVAGAAVQWLRDGLGIIASSAESEARAARVPSSNGVIVVPALTGLGAPWWNAHARGTIFGITRETTADHIVRATLEGVAHQVADLIELPSYSETTTLSIDGGMSANGLFCQVLADLTGRAVEVARTPEVTALGAAALAADAAGVAEATALIKGESPLARRVFRPTGRNVTPERERWREAVRRVTG